MKAEEITDQCLFRIIINQLWLRFDSGGISLSRSYVATLLESIMHLFPFENTYNGDFDVIKEVDARIESREQHERASSASRPIQLELPYSDIRVISHAELAFLAIREMSLWFKYRAEAAGFYSVIHGGITAKLLLMCEIAYPEILTEKLLLAKFTADEIIREGRRRQDILLAEQMRNDLVSLNLLCHDFGV